MAMHCTDTIAAVHPRSTLLSKRHKIKEKVYDGGHQRIAIEGAPAQSVAIDESKAEKQKGHLAEMEGVLDVSKY